MAASGAPLAWERLDWDSEFFGVSIGKADLDGATPESLAALDAEARAAGIQCLYGLHDPTDPLLSGVVQAGGWLLVEMLSRFQIDPDDPVHLDDTGCTVRRGTPEDLPALRASVLTMAPWSRYAVDPHFGVEAAERMHLAWVDRASRGTSDSEHHLLVAEDDTGTAGVHHPPPGTSADHRDHRHRRTRRRRRPRAGRALAAVGRRRGPVGRVGPGSQRVVLPVLRPVRLPGRRGPLPVPPLADLTRGSSRRGMIGAGTDPPTTATAGGC